MNLDKRYETVDGVKCNILQMVKIEPEWAANIIQHYEQRVPDLEEESEHRRTVLSTTLKVIAEALSGEPVPESACAIVTEFDVPNLAEAISKMRGRVADLEREHATDVEYMKIWKEKLREAEQKVSDLERENEELSQRVCDVCDGDGWQYNAVEGRVPCICMTEMEPYQDLERQLAESEYISSKKDEIISNKCEQIMNLERQLAESVLWKVLKNNCEYVYGIANCKHYRGSLCSQKTCPLPGEDP